VSFDPSQEPPIRLHDAAALKWLPNRRGGSRLNVATLFRWSSRGVRGVRLETLPVGGCRCTSEAALKRFFERLNNPGAAVQRPASVRRQAIARANSAAEAAGF
jgi:hypothetical protein